MIDRKDAPMPESEIGLDINLLQYLSTPEESTAVLEFSAMHKLQ